MTDTTNTNSAPGLTAVVMTADGAVVRAMLPTDSHGLLHSLYELIGCRSVDVVRLTERVDMWIDDEGLVNGSAINPHATLLGRRFGRTQPYAGNTVLTGPPDAEGDTTSLNEDFLKRLPDLLGIQQ